MKPLKGFKDIFGPDACKIIEVIDTMKECVKGYGYIPVFLPVVEERSLFEKSLGSGSSIVSERQMFEVTGYGVLRPETTAQIVRFYFSNNLSRVLTSFRFYTYGPMFRGENPQKGRYRQFTQFGIEFLMEKSPYADFETIKIAYDVLGKLGVSAELLINTVGCSCRQGFEKKLYEFLKDKKLCEVCNGRLNRNVLRILDCENEEVEDIPDIREFICSSCSVHFESLIKYLNSAGIKYRVEKRLVRGLDYYTKTVFEFKKGLAVVAGGRYDGIFGIKDFYGVGWASGVERLIEFKESAYNLPQIMVCVEEKNIESFIKLTGNFRFEFIGPFPSRSIKGQMRLADKLRVKKVLIFTGAGVILKDMQTGAEKEFKSIDELKKVIE